MLRGTKIASCLAALLLLLALAFAFSQSNSKLPEQKGRQQAAPRPPHTNPQTKVSQSRVPQSESSRNQPGHTGDWLRKYKGVPPAQQRGALEKDPQYRKLSPQRQAQLQKRLQHFSSRPPKEQEVMLARMETWEHLTMSQKQQARQLFYQFKQLPPARRQAVNHAIRGMRNLKPEQRDELINSDQYQKDFSPQERTLLAGASQLPLAPGGLQTEPPE